MTEKRVYKKEVPAAMEEAAKAVRSGRLSQAQASRDYDITRSRLQNYLAGAHQNSCGHPTTLSANEEEELASTLNTIAEWGFPLTKSEIQDLVKGYCDRKFFKRRFKNDNLPSEDWVESFMKRRNLVTRSAGNIKRARSAVSEEVVRDFFSNIEHLQHLQPTHVWNYDETNLTDDPGAKLVVVRRGTKRVENVCDHSKVAISLLVCGSASGELLPPYVVYKAKNVYQGWTEGGPSGTRYGCSASGWFDMSLFENWFRQIFVRHVGHLPGTKLLVGDNLASHFSSEVVRIAKENDIYFTALPANSTHLLQPLDVSVFRPMKSHWREILGNYRAECRSSGTIPKEIFPVMLSQLWQKMKNDSKSSIISGFAATGLCPRDVERPVSKLPGSTATPNRKEIREDLDATLIEMLKERRGHQNKKRARGRKFTPGQEVVLQEEDGPSSSNAVEAIDENICVMCQIPFTESYGPDWIQCQDCERWACGHCNGGSYDPLFLCGQCS